MFTWICPQCGREVPPAYNECPDCAATAAGKAPEAPAEAAAQPEPPGATPPPAPVPHSPAAPPHVVRPLPGTLVPSWALTVLLILACVGVGAGIYLGVQYYRGRGASGPPLPVDNPLPGKTGKTHPLQRYLEVTGVRLVQDAKKRTDARFVLINHSNAEIVGLEGNVIIWGRTRKSDEEAEGTFAFKVPSIGPFESKELTSVVNTKLKIYELPDWQNTTAELQITAPAP